MRQKHVLLPKYLATFNLNVSTLMAPTRSHPHCYLTSHTLPPTSTHARALMHTPETHAHAGLSGFATRC